MGALRTAMTLAVLLLVSHVPAGEHFQQNIRRRPYRRRQSDLPPAEDPDLILLSDAAAASSDSIHLPYPVRRPYPDCPTDCRLHVANLKDLNSDFQDLLERQDTRLVHFRIHFVDYVIPVMETYPYMSPSYRATEWIWAAEGYGRKLLSLPLDADVLSLYILDRNRKHFDVRVTTTPDNCLVTHSPECRLHAVRSLLIHNVTYVERHRHRRDYVCHYVIINSNSVVGTGSVGSKAGTGAFGIESGNSHLLYRCCETDAFRAGDVTCRVYTDGGDSASNQNEVTSVLRLIDALAVLLTLFSPVLVLRVKMALKFDSVTKFFRASLKHGITGQRNYVIRISSRQLIDLADRHPFSIPRSVFRLLCHGYGEGRCCIHWWADWRHQPTACRDKSCCRRCWFVFCRTLAIVVVYPAILYGAVALYSPRLPFYHALVNHTRQSEVYRPIALDINLVAAALTPNQNIAVAVWILFSVCAFVYTITVLSSPNNPLERCLLRYEGKRPFDQPAILYRRMTTGYKAVLQRLAYGDYPTKRHFFRVPCVPWGLRRVFNAVVRVLAQIPVVNICFTTFMYDAKIFDSADVAQRPTPDKDEASDKMSLTLPTGRMFCRWCLAAVVWIGFVLILVGYCTAFFLMTEFLLNVVFFVAVGATLHAAAILPWIGAAVVVAFYANDTLATINAEHRHVLRLIDENSPRISAVEEAEEVFREGAAVQILKTHNLGAVKFIDGDNTEYVSKELYYAVCADLKCGWSATWRRIVIRMSFVVLFVALFFASLSAVAAFVGGGSASASVFFFAGVIGGAMPKLAEVYARSSQQRSRPSDLRAIWARVIPDILDRHIRVDRTRCLDDTEEELTTYDVRPIGLLEMDVPRMTVQRTLRLWKFPWMVSGDQQTQTHEGFVVALANKLAAASLLSKVVTRSYSPLLDDESVLRQWSLLVENCILEGSTTAGGINGTPIDSVHVFPRDVQPLVVPFDAGNTIDQVVDSINRELYGPYTKGVLVTIGNTSCAVCKLDRQIIAFNSSCHGDQVTDLFGAVLIAADFNTQNLQTTIKYLVDPYRPDAVPVYSIVPVEGFIFRSPEILEIESVV